MTARDGTLAEKARESDAVQAKMDQLTDALTNSTTKIASLRTKLHQYKQQLAAYKMSDAEKADTEKIAAEVPVVRQGDTIIFPHLLGPAKTELLANAEFVRANGRNLIFKHGIDYSVFDVDAVHPGVLIQLNLDRNALVADQEAIDRRNKDWATQNAAAVSQNLDANAEFLAEQEAAREARLRAIARIRAANAAILNAQNQPQ